MNKRKVLVVVDMQNDFIDGALGTKEAEAIVPGVLKKIESFEGEIIFTRDTHGENYLRTQEGRKLPVKHCIEGTDGWQFHRSLQDCAKNAPVFDKPGFGSMVLPQYLKNKGGAPDEILLIGLCTDICVICNAMILKGAFPEAEITVDSSCCAGTTIQNHLNALNAMEVCQINII